MRREAVVNPHCRHSRGAGAADVVDRVVADEQAGLTRHAQPRRGTAEDLGVGLGYLLCLVNESDVNKRPQARKPELVILQEGSQKKFVNEINQVTFSGPHAVDIEQNVLYITDRCVFKLTKDGLKLTEVAPGIDIDTQILPYMDFKPIIDDDVKEMDPKIFQEGLIGLKDLIK